MHEAKLTPPVQTVTTAGGCSPIAYNGRRGPIGRGFALPPPRRPLE